LVKRLSFFGTSGNPPGTKKEKLSEKENAPPITTDARHATRAGHAYRLCIDQLRCSSREVSAANGSATGGRVGHAHEGQDLQPEGPPAHDRDAIYSNDLFFFTSSISLGPTGVDGGGGGGEGGVHGFAIFECADHARRDTHGDCDWSCQCRGDVSWSLRAEREPVNGGKRVREREHCR
jgi:hypothetical protein